MKHAQIQAEAFYLIFNGVFRILQSFMGAIGYVKTFSWLTPPFLETKFLAVLSLGTFLKGFLQRAKELSLVGTQYRKGNGVEVFSD